MVMTKEQRVELLKLAREAKAKKKIERDADKPKPVMGRPKKQKETVEDTFEPPVEEPVEVDEPKMKVNDDEIDSILDKGKIEPKRRLRDRGRSLELRLKEKQEPKVQMKEDDEEEVQEEIIYKKKPKKKILRKIIYEESTDDEVEEVVIDNRKKKQVEKPAKVKEVTKPVQLSAPKEPEVKSFNFFRY